MAEGRRYDRNPGLVTLPQIPDDQWIAGVVVVLYDEDGNYTTSYRAVGMDELPTPEVREELGTLITHAWEVANHPGFTTEEN